MATFKRSNRFADRGKVAENAMQAYLDWWVEQSQHREYNRLPDTKAAGRIIKAAPADFDYYSGDVQPAFGLIEVKETKHDFRLDRDKLSQLARLRKREKCGGRCPVVVFHSEIKKWRCVPRASELMDFGDKGSWDLSRYPTFERVDHALAYASQVFEVRP